MSEPVEIHKLKICMAGEGMVGKTSLIRRYVLDAYEDRYIATLGTKITKMGIELTNPDSGERAHVDLILWDIMGTPTLRELLKEAYYHGAAGILGVVDLTRRETLRELDAWSKSIRSVAGDIPTFVTMNKADLEESRELDDAEIEEFCRPRDWPWAYTSAKTGMGVPAAFEGLVHRILARRQAVR